MRSSRRAFTRRDQVPLPKLDPTPHRSPHADGLEKQGRFAEAGPVWRDALDQHRKLLGERDPLVAAGMQRLARSIELQGDDKRAEPMRRSISALLQEDADFSAGVPEAHSAQSYKALEILRAAGKGGARSSAGTPSSRYGRELWRPRMAERAIGHEKEGKALIATALEIDEHTLAAHHPETKALRKALASAPPVRQPTPVLVDY